MPSQKKKILQNLISHFRFANSFLKNIMYSVGVTN